MAECQFRKRRAVALLAVLGFIVVASTAVIASARIAATSGFAVQQHEASLESTSFMNAIRSTCLQWILRRGDTALTEDSLPYAAIVVLDDEFELANEAARIRIFAYDQDTRLRITPQNWSASGANWDRDPNDRLDELSISDLEEAAVRNTGIARVFPQTRAGQALLGVMRSPLEQSHRITPGITLNPRTVPYEVLAMLFGDSANELYERVREWRSERSGRSSAFSQGFQKQAGSPRGPVAWQTKSSAWAFRIDIEFEAALTRSFWAVYAIDNGEWQLDTWHIIRDGGP